MQRIISLFLAALVLAGCSGTSNVSKQSQPPSWVQARPNVPGYYVGIGSARKTTPDYQQAAKQSALADLASDISVVISANSVLNAFENQQRFFEDYTSNIRAEAQKELEDYEVVGTWEDQQTYWIYYRLSRETYRRIMDEKKSAAAAKSLDFYDKALAARQDNDIKTALVMLIKALEPIKPYFAETITVTHGNQTIYLGNEIIKTITSILNSISVNGPAQLSAKMGQGVPASLTTYAVTESSGLPLRAIPLRVNYTERPLANSRITTDAQGAASVTIDAVRSLKTAEVLRVSLDFESVVQEATTDFAIRKVLMRFSGPTTETRLVIEKPSFYVSSDERNLGASLEQHPLANGIKRKLVEAGFPLTNSPSGADYRLSLIASTHKTGQIGQFVQVGLRLQVLVTNAAGLEVYHRTNDRISASHFEAAAAGQNAYNNALKRIELTIVGEIIDNVLKGNRGY